MNLISIFLAAFGIGLLIFVHELGHFLAARLAGVHVERFSIGFGPRLWGFKWRGTDFLIAAVPFGGYVMAAGADPNDHRYPPEVSLNAKSIPHRALFWSGGVLMNVLFALIVFPIVFHSGVKVPAPVIGAVSEGGPAWEVGIRPGDELISLEGRPMRSFETFRIDVALKGHRPLDVTVRHADGTEETVELRPRFDPEDGLYEVGIEVAYEHEVTVTEEGSARNAGLESNDRVVSVQGVSIEDSDLLSLLGTMQSGHALTIEASREGVRRTVTVPAVAAKEPGPLRIGVRPLPRKIRGLRRDSEIVRRLGLERGDVILAVDGLPFLGGELAPYGVGRETLSLHLLRDGKEVVVQRGVSAAERTSFTVDVVLEPDESMRLQPTPDHPAISAGLLPGDLVRKVNGETIEDWADLKQVVESCEGKPLRFELLRTDASADQFFVAGTKDLGTHGVVELTIRPEHVPTYEYGLSLVSRPIQTEIKASGLGEALQLGVISSVDLVKQAYVMLKRMITGDVGANNLGGIVRISEFSYRAAEQGTIWFWYFLALISLNLAFVNLLPIPILDGGHLIFLLIEKVKGSPVSERVFGYSQLVGLVFVLLLVLFVTYNDIMRLL